MDAQRRRGRGGRGRAGAPAGEGGLEGLGGLVVEADLPRPPAPTDGRRPLGEELRRRGAVGRHASTGRPPETQNKPAASWLANHSDAARTSNMLPASNLGKTLYNITKSCCSCRGHQNQGQSAA